ncbi:MAG: hypothetical protein HY321_11405 [Armatimonadetes bacterium]|nr:hypothetical protein [Armatimonadota bacterium]
MVHASWAPWHKESYDHFLNAALPELLAERLPLAGYQVEDTGPNACQVRIALAAPSGEVAVGYPEIPRPDEEGLFYFSGKARVVVPTAAHEDLATAEIRCVGEQILALFRERLGEAPKDLPWEASLARSWLPLDAWVLGFLRETAQWLDDTNALSRITHLRRLIVPERQRVVTPGQFGRVCPFETPEGPNIGRAFSIAVGAAIRDGMLVVLDESPEAALGVTASMVPFLEQNDPNRQLMGVNMMRQAMPPAGPQPEVVGTGREGIADPVTAEAEPALVQTGREPDVPGIWFGRNLLTAFVSLGAETYEDGIVLSESCAARLGHPKPIEPGDKLSNRHGTKGVVSRILRDDEMPRLPDGTPVEMVFSFIGLHTRQNFGQIREALTGRIARAEGCPAIVPPFHAPTEAELRERLARAGLPEDGMERLTPGRGGPAMERRSMVGWVYWLRNVHVASEKIHATVQGGRPQRQSLLDYQALRAAGAVETIREQFNTRAAEREGADALAARAAAGPITQAPPPAPAFAEMVKRLAVGGVRAELADGRLAFRLAPPEGDVIRLARPVPHPWLRGHELDAVGATIEGAERAALIQANDRLRRTLDSGAPSVLAERAAADLETRAREFLASLLRPEHLRPHAAVLFSARSVVAPGYDLGIDQVGIPEEMAWTLFGPLVARELGSEDEVRARTPRAARALDEAMARSWVVVNRAPSLSSTSFVASHPVRRPENAIRLHPAVCPLLNADFDGDQVAVFLPLTEAGQREAGERISLAGHLRRDPAVVALVYPRCEALWGLAWLSRAPGGQEEIAHLAGTDVPMPEGFLTADALTGALTRLLEREGASPVLAAVERLQARGFEVARHSGASMSPFPGESLARPPQPESAAPEAWSAYAEELADALAARSDIDSPDLGPQLLAVKSGARGQIGQLAILLGGRGWLPDASGRVVPIRHGWPEGLTPEELFAQVAVARTRLGEMHVEMDAAFRGEGRQAPMGFGALARAMRATDPGAIFARAAAAGEVDPLADPDSRLFVGLALE